jgi:predicted component of type VI protein secretion system
MDVAKELAQLEFLASATLRERWQALVGMPVPRVSPKMLRLALAWELQAKAHGGLPRSTTRLLDQFERKATRTTPTKPGMRLVREWQGRVHVVIVGEDQIIRWDDREWRSLSEVARAITGTRWSGPAFFGLKKKVVA